MNRFVHYPMSSRMVASRMPSYYNHPYIQVPYSSQHMEYPSFYGPSQYLTPVPTQYINPPFQPPHGFDPYVQKGRPPMEGIINSFKKSDGTIDINKMANTFGQVMNTVNQVGPIMKQMSSLFTKV